MRRALLTLATLAALLSLAPVAAAHEGALTPVPCPAGCATYTDAPAAPFRALVSPDSRFLYVQQTRAIRIIALDPATGLPAPSPLRGCVGQAPGCVQLAPRLIEFGPIALSPDGSRLYATSNDGLYTLGRNSATGALTVLDCDGEFASACGASSEWPSNVAVTASGAVVTSSSFHARLESFHATVGGLALTGCLDDDPLPTTCAKATPEMFQGSLVAIGESVYTAGIRRACMVEPCGIVRAAAVAADGSLALLPGTGGCLAADAGCDPTPAISQVLSLVGAGGALLVSTTTGNHLLARGADGVLGAELPCNGVVPCAGQIGVPVASAGIVGPVWFVHSNVEIDTLHVTSAGATRLRCAGIGACPLLDVGTAAVAAAPDGRTVYAVDDQRIQVVLGDRPPRCDGGALQTWATATTSFPLPCSDPNRDPLTWRIVQQPPGAGLSTTPSGLRVVAGANVGRRTGTIEVADDGGHRVRASVVIDVRPPPALALRIDGINVRRGHGGHLRATIPYGHLTVFRLSAPSGPAPMASFPLALTLGPGSGVSGTTDDHGAATIRAKLYLPRAAVLRAPTIPGVKPLVVELSIIPTFTVTRGSDHKIRGLVRAGLQPMLGRVDLQRRRGSRWITIASARVRHRFTFAPHRGTLRVRYVPRAGYGFASTTKPVPR